MATWKKVIVSGSNAELNQITASGGVNAILPSSQQPNFVSYNASTGQFGYFGTGSLTAATASFVTASNVYGPYGSNSVLSASYALSSSNAQLAVTATTTTITDTTTGTGPYYITFTAANTGNSAQLVDSTGLTYNATTNTITTTASFATSASYVTGSVFTSANPALSASYALSSSFALTAATATTATNATNATNIAVTDTITGTGPYYLTFTAANTGNTAALVDSTGLTYNATTNTIAATSSVATSASYAASVNNITNAITNNTDNRVLTATGAGTINGESNLTFDGTTLTVTGNEVITGNLIVQGTASFQNTTNLEVADRFVLLASGSNTAGDGGLVIQQATQNVGELFGYENAINRWGFTSSFTANNPSFTPSAYVTTTEVGTVIPSAAPIYGGSGNGFGNIYVKTDTGDIYIYS